MHKGVLWWVYPFKLPVLLQVVFNWLEHFLLFYLVFNFSLMKCMNYWIPLRHCLFNHNLDFFFLSFLFLYANSAFLMLLVIKNAPFSHANTNWRWGWLVFFLHSGKPPCHKRKAEEVLELTDSQKQIIIMDSHPGKIIPVWLMQCCRHLWILRNAIHVRSETEKK